LTKLPNILLQPLPVLGRLTSRPQARLALLAGGQAETTLI
jgi:hypothetical protein